MTLSELVDAFVKLGGVATFLAAVINVLKTLGLVKDGAAPKVSLFLNLAFFVLFSVGGVLGFNLADYDSVIGLIGNLLIALLAIFLQTGASAWVHDVILKPVKLPLISKSYS